MNFFNVYGKILFKGLIMIFEYNFIIFILGIIIVFLLMRICIYKNTIRDLNHIIDKLHQRIYFREYATIEDKENNNFR